ncbi:hypothetical protein AY599_16555 [Leptolyngbya valderiana BDU 20041]|nr:hypothetical protein AY599_16555 [Leptolyngbya valderiana BDU 20041]
MHRRRGFTLIEVLVALGLLVVITSLALPVALTNTQAARARTAERVLTLSPAVARGEAQRRGVPVALVLAPTEDGQGLRLLVVREPQAGSDDAADQAADPQDVTTWPAVDQPRQLPEGTRLWRGDLDELEAFETRRQLDAAADVGSDGGDAMLDRAFAEPAAPMAPAGAMDDRPDAVTLAWYLSDGSAVAGDATVVRLADGRVVRARIEPLVGRLLFTRAPELEEGAQAQDPADEDPTDPDRAPAGESDPADGPPMDDAGSPEGRPAPGFDPLEFDRPQFEQRAFDRPEFDERAFDPLEFDRPEFDRPEFDRPEFDPLEFDSLEPDDRREGEDASRQPQEKDGARRTNPEPPQPR